MKIAVLGMGQMGRSLASRLIEGTHELSVWNRTSGHAATLVAAGATECQTAAEAAGRADVIMASLTDDDAVRAVLAPEGAPLEGVGPDDVVVDCSTVSPETSRALSGVYEGRFVAAPIMGSPDALAAGKAFQVIAGPPEVLDRLAPVWSAVAAGTRRCGDDPGRASVVKLVSNYLLLSGIATLAEAVAIAQRAGLGDDFVEDLFGTSPLVAAGLQNRLASIIGTSHEGWFPTPLGAKDIGLVVDMARTEGLELPLASAVHARYVDATEQGLAEADIAGVVELYRR